MSRSHGASVLRHPPPEDTTLVLIQTLKELACFVVGAEYRPGTDVMQIIDVPKKRLQSLLRSQLAIEYLVKVVEHCWVHYFERSVARVKLTRDAASACGWGGGRASTRCASSPTTYSSCSPGNWRCADTLQSIDAVELLLAQLPSGWNFVIEVFGALMRHDGEAAAAAPAVQVGHQG